MAAATVIGCGVKRTLFPGRGELETLDFSRPSPAPLVRPGLFVSPVERFLRRMVSDAETRSAGDVREVDIGTVRDANGVSDGGAVDVAIKYTSRYSERS